MLASPSSLPQLPPRATIAGDGAPPAPPRAASRRWRGGRVLALLGAALFAVAAWLPWAVAGVASPLRPSMVMRFFLNPGFFVGYPLTLLPGLGGSAEPLWSFLTVLGLLICPFLWAEGRWGRRIAPLAYSLWLLAAGTVSAWAAYQVLLGGVAAAPGSAILRVTPHIGLLLVRRQASFGLPLVAASLILGTLGACLLLRALWHGTFADRAPAAMPRARRHRVGAALVLAGVAAWGAGYLIVPWANSGQSLGAQLTQHSTGATQILLDRYYPVAFGARILSQAQPLIGQGAIWLAVPQLLVVGALLLALAAWLVGGSPIYRRWAAVWLLAAASATGWATWTAVAIAHAPEYAGVGAGAPVAIAGLALVALGLAWPRPRQIARSAAAI